MVSFSPGQVINGPVFGQPERELLTGYYKGALQPCGRATGHGSLSQAHSQALVSRMLWCMLESPLILPYYTPPHRARCPRPSLKTKSKPQSAVRSTSPRPSGAARSHAVSRPFAAPAPARTHGRQLAVPPRRARSPLALPRAARLPRASVRRPSDIVE